MYTQRLLIVVLLVAVTAAAFVPQNLAPSGQKTTTTTFRRMMVAKELSSNDVVESESLDFDDDDDDDYEDDDGDFEISFDEDESSELSADTDTTNRPKSSRWDSLNPTVKDRVIQKGQERAIANKKKREPGHDKKRREYLFDQLIYRALYFVTTRMLNSSLSFFLALAGMLMFMRTKQRNKKRESRVQRPLSFKDRTPLAALIPGMETKGMVISLTDFGAYVDIGTECDGLLHVSQMSSTFFVEHPKQVVTPGDEVTVRIRSTSPDRKKLHLTMLPLEILQAEQEDDVDERIPLSEIQADDELWGELKRVTDYGAYVEVGAAVSGFLHFMDHPAFGWSKGSRPSEFMSINDRVRVWVMDVDHEQKRIKLTANRPLHLPGPRREI
jgi:predicted RNA-binding protein with RPS1 domain